MILDKEYASVFNATVFLLVLQVLLTTNLVSGDKSIFNDENDCQSFCQKIPKENEPDKKLYPKYSLYLQDVDKCRCYRDDSKTYDLYNDKGKSKTGPGLENGVVGRKPIQTRITGPEECQSFCQDIPLEPGSTTKKYPHLSRYKKSFTGRQICFCYLADDKTYEEYKQLKDGRIKKYFTDEFYKRKSQTYIKYRDDSIKALLDDQEKQHQQHSIGHQSYEHLTDPQSSRKETDDQETTHTTDTQPSGESTHDRHSNDQLEFDDQEAGKPTDSRPSEEPNPHDRHSYDQVISDEHSDENRPGKSTDTQTSGWLNRPKTLDKENEESTDTIPSEESNPHDRLSNGQLIADGESTNAETSRWLTHRRKSRVKGTEKSTDTRPLEELNHNDRQSNRKRISYEQPDEKEPGQSTDTETSGWLIHPGKARNKGTEESTDTRLSEESNPHDRHSNGQLISDGESDEKEPSQSTDIQTSGWVTLRGKSGDKRSGQSTETQSSGELKPHGRHTKVKMITDGQSDEKEPRQSTDTQKSGWLTLRRKSGDKGTRESEESTDTRPSKELNHHGRHSTRKQISYEQPDEKELSQSTDIQTSGWVTLRGKSGDKRSGQSTETQSSGELKPHGRHTKVKMITNEKSDETEPKQTTDTRTSKWLTLHRKSGDKRTEESTDTETSGWLILHRKSGDKQTGESTDARPSEELDHSDRHSKRKLISYEPAAPDEKRPGKSTDTQTSKWLTLHRKSRDKGIEQTTDTNRPSTELKSHDRHSNGQMLYDGQSDEKRHRKSTDTGPSGWFTHFRKTEQATTDNNDKYKQNINSSPGKETSNTKTKGQTNQKSLPILLDVSSCSPFCEENGYDYGRFHRPTSCQCFRSDNSFSVYNEHGNFLYSKRKNKHK